MDENVKNGGARKKLSIKKIIILMVLAVLIILGIEATVIYYYVNSPDYAIHTASRYLAESDYDSAIECLNLERKKSPQNADVILLLSDAYLGYGDYNNAVDVLYEAGYAGVDDNRIADRISALYSEYSDEIEQNYEDSDVLAIEEMLKNYLYNGGELDTEVMKRITSLEIYGDTLMFVKCGRTGGTDERNYETWFNHDYDGKVTGCFVEDEYGKRTNISRGTIKDISFVKYLVNATRINIKYNQVEDLTPVTELKKLRNLSLVENNININDLSSLLNLTELRTLALAGCGISDISLIGDFKELTGVGFGDNMITDIAPLKKCNKLEWVYLWSNRINDISPLFELDNLNDIEIEYNKVSSDDINKLRERFPEARTDF